MGDTQKTGVAMANLKERLGGVFDEIFALGRQVGREAGYREGLAEGARVERERVKAALAQPLPGHEARGDEPDRATGGTEAAQKVQAAAKAKPSGFLSKIKGVTGRQPLPAPEESGPGAANSGPSVEDRCRAEWEREPGLRSEFATLEAYTDFTRQRKAGLLG